MRKQAVSSARGGDRRAPADMIGCEHRGTKQKLKMHYEHRNRERGQAHSFCKLKRHAIEIYLVVKTTPYYRAFNNGLLALLFVSPEYLRKSAK